MTTPFDVATNIMSSITVLDDDQISKGHVPWIVNKVLAQNIDLVLTANIINQYANLPVKTQYQYLHNVVRKTKRPYQKWLKESPHDDLRLICNHYQCSPTVAKQYLEHLSSSDLTNIRSKYREGGLNK